MQKQVDKAYYSFSKYIDKKRWISVWHQLNEIMSLNPSSVLEIGPGPGIFKVLAGHFGISVETADIDPELNPDFVASATKLPLRDNSYDCVCAFQMLEHIPYKQALQAFSELIRVARHNILISLPDAKKIWLYEVHIPQIGTKMFQITKPFSRPHIHRYDGQHYWEINKKNYSLEKVIYDFSMKGAILIKNYRVKEIPYHRFFLFEPVQ